MRVALLVFAYLLGAVPFGVIVTRLWARKDVRSVGSGNIGATNVARAAGKKAAALVLLLDALKGLVPVLIARALLDDPWWIAGVGLAAFLGHVFPVYLGFRGGKGVATALGVTLAVAPLAGVAGALTYVAVYKIWRVSSVGSLSAALVATALAFLTVGHEAYGWLVLAMVLLIFARHTGNIRRLIQRQESKV